MVLPGALDEVEASRLAEALEGGRIDLAAAGLADLVALGGWEAEVVALVSTEAAPDPRAPGLAQILQALETEVARPGP